MAFGKNCTTVFCLKLSSAVYHTCLIVKARRQEEETYGEVKAVHSCSGFIMLTGAWLSPKHNSWWSEEPEEEPQGARWPAHSFTGSLHRGQETAGFWEQEMRLASVQILAPSRSQRTRMCQEASQWQMFHLTHVEIGGSKRCEHWTQAHQAHRSQYAFPKCLHLLSSGPWINDSETMKAGDILSQASSTFSERRGFKLVVSWH